MKPEAPVSLKRRFLNHSALCLFILMSLCAVVIYINFVDDIEKNAQERLQLHVYNILSVAEFRDEVIELPDILYNPLFNTLDSGLWAMVLDQNGKNIWHSLSVSDTDLSISLPEKSGQWQAGDTQLKGNTYLTMAYRVQWIGENNNPTFNLVIGESKNKNDGEIKKLTLWLILGFGGIASLLLIGQNAVLRQSFKPIAKMANEITDLEMGKRESLSGSYPEELMGVERNINALIKKEHQQRERYREGMANLAHSLKTPLTIIASELAIAPENPTLKQALEQANSTIEYQLRRAVISGHTLLSKGVDISEVISSVTEAVSKIYQDKKLHIEQNLDPSAVFHGDENDLMEIFGNLLDNAYKHAQKSIFITTSMSENGICIVVEDDGPGLNTDDPSRVFRRGERLDQRGFGQGIGLAVVQDIVTSYEGNISASRSAHGGARFTLNFSNRK